MTSRSVLLTSAVLATACVVSACRSSAPTDPWHASTASASAELEGRSGSSLSGEAWFLEDEAGVMVHVRVEGAPPGWHAVHVHELGDCSADDGSSAGDHFDPDGHRHGAPHAPEQHAGDLGNLWVDATGTGYHSLRSPVLTVAPGAHSVVGRSLVVHAAPDDFVSQPSGAAGARIGCGEIR